MIRRLLLPCAVWTAVLCAATTALQAADGYRAALFNGRDLDGWQVSGCTPTVDDGLLVLGGADGWLRTNEKHGDFVLELDWRNPKPSEYDSGTYIRPEPPAAGKPFPNRYQINLKQGGEG